MSFPFPCGSRAVIGVVHLPALPGSPGHTLSRSEILDHALADARALSMVAYQESSLKTLAMPLSSPIRFPTTRWPT